ncbi:putative metal-binding motif-containing protein [Candidatus Falkowbacteria bacterium]|nr:putative metal-binding motif-containing protein [Candidatus Falkowbacteria bacterium]
MKRTMLVLLVVLFASALFACQGSDAPKENNYYPADDDASDDDDGGESVCPDSDGDGFTATDCGGTDCDDSDPAVWRITRLYNDNDLDGFGALPLDEVCVGDVDAPLGTSFQGNDCDDANAQVHPTAQELCDGIDNNCTGGVDEGGVCQNVSYFCDSDGDRAVSQSVSGSCDSYGCIPDGCQLGPGTDCNDGDPGSWQEQTLYNDHDQDSFGAGAGLPACVGTDPPPGFSFVADDCNDASEFVNPSAAEICDGIDNNCTGGVDEGGVCFQTPYYCDNDNDGYVALAVTGQCVGSGCIPADCFATPGTDCDDRDQFAWSYILAYADGDRDGFTAGGQVMVCSGLSLPPGYGYSNDADCNDGDPLAWQFLPGYADADLDHHGSGSQLQVCSGFNLPSGFAADNTDCDGGDGEIWRLGNFYQDFDQDSFGVSPRETVCYGYTTPVGFSVNNGDCNDLMDEINPAALEICSDTLDNDCNGLVDSADPSC